MPGCNQPAINLSPGNWYLVTGNKEKGMPGCNQPAINLSPGNWYLVTATKKKGHPMLTLRTTPFLLYSYIREPYFTVKLTAASPHNNVTLPSLSTVNVIRSVNWGALPDFTLTRKASSASAYL